MARVEVKICGICRARDAALAASAGADYVGVILSPVGPRAQDAESAAAIYRAAGDARRVGVFVDPSVAEVRWLASRLRLDVAQLHGDEPPEVARELRAGGLEVWKAVRVRSPADVGEALAAYGGAVDALLLDGYAEGLAGGSGTGFDWAGAAEAWRAHRAAAGTWRSGAGPRLVVAGGLDATNVAAAMDALRPAVVDVASGVEASPGEKSEAAVREFIAEVRGWRLEAGGGRGQGSGTRDTRAGP